MDFVVSLSGLQAVMKLSEEFVEHGTFGFREPVPFGYAHLAVSLHSGRRFQ
ncbi:hypothetical protein ABIE52_006949 [Rhodococcus sp. OAS809]